MMKRTAFLLLALSVAAIYGGRVNAAEDTIQNSKRVKIDYTLKVDGNIIESTLGKEPLEYVHGRDPILPGLMKQLLGLKKGDHRVITVASADGFGAIDPKAVVEMPKAKLPKGEIKVGTALTAPGAGKNGQDLRCTVKELRGDTVILDFNHPFAGKDLNFEVDIVEILPGTVPIDKPASPEASAPPVEPAKAPAK